MSEYIVKTHAFVGSDGRNLERSLIIEADFFTNSGVSYEFYTRKDGVQKLVASVQSREVLAVLEFEDAYQADILDGFEEDEFEEDEACLDDRFKDLLKSEEFFNAVCSAYDTIQEADGDEPGVQYRSHKGNLWYGFVDEDGNFVHFQDRENAVQGLKMYQDGDRNWATLPLSETEIVKETVQ